MGTSYGDFIKYPRTPHLAGSTGTSDDTHLSPLQSAEFLANGSLVIEEKLDGTNVGIHFSDDGILVLQCRGHLITEGMHPQYDLFKHWASAKQHFLAKYLQRRYILFGEWMYAKHNIRYERLPHYFIALDVYDKDEAAFLSSEARANMISDLAVSTAPVLHSGPTKLGLIDNLLTASRFSAHSEQPSNKRTEDVMEGLYFRIETAGVVAARAKYVRREFAIKVQQNSDWRHRAMVPNLLAEGADIWQ